MPTVCELKTGKSAPKKEYPKPKPFVPAPTKGESPIVAEKKIDKKIKLFMKRTKTMRRV